MYKAVVSDLDGTLLNEEQRLVHLRKKQLNYYWKKE